jgi:hypothetical protein
MDTRKRLIAGRTVILVVLLTLGAVGIVVGQEPEPPLPEPEASTGSPEVEGNAGTEDEVGIMARPAKTMNYQGYLTGSSGNPLDGNYDMVFSLWDAEAAGTGTMEWGTETHNDVPVSKGLFSVVLGETVPMDPWADFDEQLYLQITVNGTTLPRQMLRAVPYAMGLTIGAAAIGATTESDDYGLWVENTNGPGLYVNGNTTYGIFNADVTRSDDGYAGPDTYLFVSPLNAIMPHSASGEHLSSEEGYMMVVADSAGTAGVRIPIQIERPYGRDYLLRSARVYYKTTEASITYAAIKGIDLTDGTVPLIGGGATTQSSAAFDYFDIDATQNYSVTSTMVPASIVLSFNMSTNFGIVYLYGVRLTLDSTY